MDAHGNEYLAAAAAMREMYGEMAEDRERVRHDDVETAARNTAPADVMAALAEVVVR